MHVAKFNHIQKTVENKFFFRWPNILVIDFSAQAFANGGQFRICS
jgi:hypothetical protein